MIRVWLLIIALLVGVLGAGCQESALDKFLSGFKLEGFVQEGPILVYDAHNLFNYINGEAETYLDRGFHAAYVITLQREDGRAPVTVDVYEMTHSKGARAVLEEFASQSRGQKVDGFGDAAITDGVIFQLCRDRFFIKIMPGPVPDPKMEATPDDLLYIARTVDRRFSGQGIK